MSTLRIGVIGTENTHGLQYTSFLNGWREDIPIPVRFDGALDSSMYLWACELREESEGATPRVPVPGARVTRAWSSHEHHLDLLQRACGVDPVTEPEQALVDVDAVMVLTGDPISHEKFARLALEQGLPTFVDKPIASSVDGCRSLLDFADRHNTCLWSTSALRFAKAYHVAKQVSPDRVGTLRSLHVQCPLSWSQYGIHCVEAMNVFLGHDVIDVDGLRMGDHVVGAVRMRSGQTAILETLGFFGAPEYNVTLYGDEGNWFVRRRQGDRSLLSVAEQFVSMMKVGTPPTDREELLAIVEITERVAQAANSA